MIKKHEWNYYDMKIRACERDSSEWKDAVYQRGLAYLWAGRDDDAMKDFMMAGKAPPDYVPPSIVGVFQLAQTEGGSYISNCIFIKHLEKIFMACFPKLREIYDKSIKDLYDIDIFADLENNMNRAALYSKFHYLYHVVPEEHVSNFERGIIALDKADNIRRKEESINDDMHFSEGTRRNVIQDDGCLRDILIENEFFFLCFSTSQDIKEIREYYDSKIKNQCEKNQCENRILYRVDMEKLVPAILRALCAERYLVEEGGSWRYFIEDEKFDNSWEKDVLFMGGAIKYLNPDFSQTGRMPVDTYFLKYHRFEDEKEFRLAFEFTEKARTLVEKAIRKSRVLSTTGDSKIMMQINPYGCFRRITR